MCAPEPGYDWAGYVSALEAAAGVVPVEFRARGRDGVIVTSIGQDRGPELLAGIDPSVRLFGYGAAIEVYKDVGPAAEVCAATAWPAWAATRRSATPGWRPSRR